MNNQEMMELTTVDKSEFEQLVKECRRSGSIDQNLYIDYDVKRGLRDSNGNGVLTVQETDLDLKKQHIFFYLVIFQHRSSWTVSCAYLQTFRSFQAHLSVMLL